MGEAQNNTRSSFRVGPSEGRRWTVFVCPECGSHYNRPGGHAHKDGSYSRFLPVEVVPVSEAKPTTKGADVETPNEDSQTRHNAAITGPSPVPSEFTGEVLYDALIAAGHSDYELPSPQALDDALAAVEGKERDG